MPAKMKTITEGKKKKVRGRLKGEGDGDGWMDTVGRIVNEREGTR